MKKINIEGTPLEIIANANNLKQIRKSNIFTDSKGQKFILNKLGFSHVEIYNAQTLKEESEAEIKRLKSKIIELETQIDDLEYRLIESDVTNKAEKQIKHLEQSLLNSAEKNKRLKVELNFEKRITDFVYHSKSLSTPEFLDFHQSVRDEWKEYKKSLKD